MTHDHIGMHGDKLHNGYEYVQAFIHISGLENGPAIGGCRIHHYGRISEAMENVVDLSRGMRYKAACAGLPYGGGKAVIATDPDVGKNRRLLRNFADMVNSFGGDYITAEDSGTDIHDMDYLAEHTDHVVGLSRFSGNPSPITAFGVYHGLQACLAQRGRDSFDGLEIALKGAGSVGSYLVFGFPENDSRFDGFDFPGLINLGVKAIYFAEKDSETSFKFKARATSIGKGNLLHARSPDEICDIAGLDVFIPSAARYSCSGKNIDFLAKSMQTSDVRIIAGPENNQIRHGTTDIQRITDAGILYAPDFVINAGGLINVHFGKLARDRNTPYDSQAALRKAADIGKTIATIVKDAEGSTTVELAQNLAERRIRKSTASV
jgi:leucine dehydrogenase